ncbi:hypothetical protein [Curtobacterium sp. MCSS17_007]|uniref:hypothetical protein n=1 Tax=Curtobacterium sp. MCSS17_007 TaxID=2175646 RepID=UPI000DA786E8|nr:hypothetical protein [Curtobacterium sp. MCSS17_007]WIE74337.1 hypothetical protein DEJ22_008545 [Curtobacterium sp. MCSS17_007]
MSPFAARCCLVGAALLLAALGVLGDVPGTARVVLLVAAACCGGLDVLVVRTAPSVETGSAPLIDPLGADPFATATPDADPLAAGPVDTGRLGADPLGAGTTGAEPDGAHRPSADEASADEASADEASADEASADEASADQRGADRLEAAPFSDPEEERRRGVISLGRTADGRPVRVSTGADGTCHLVVVGVGALADAVFAAIATQLTVLDGSAPGGTAVEVREAFGPGVGRGAVTGAESPALPDGTAVAVRLEPDGGPLLTVVLVPGLHLLPRQWDHLVEVSRHGCRVQDRSGARWTTIEPVLPVLTEAADAGRVDAGRGHAGLAGAGRVEPG